MTLKSKYTCSYAIQGILHNSNYLEKVHFINQRRSINAAIFTFPS